jgi:hypothetical protein
MPSSLYFIKAYKDIQATEDEKPRQTEATSFRYVVDKMHVQIDRHGRSSLSLDGNKNEP